MIGQGLKKGTEIFMRILDAWPFLADPLMIVLRSTVYFWEEGGVERVGMGRVKTRPKAVLANPTRTIFQRT